MKKDVFYLLGIILLMVSCYPDDTVYYEDTDLVYTNYTETFDFASKGSYDVSRVNNAIDQAFTQSPYLNTK